MVSAIGGLDPLAHLAEAEHGIGAAPLVAVGAVRNDLALELAVRPAGAVHAETALRLHLAWAAFGRRRPAAAAVEAVLADAAHGMALTNRALGHRHAVAARATLPGAAVAEL